MTAAEQWRALPKKLRQEIVELLDQAADNEQCTPSDETRETAYRVAAAVLVEADE